MTTKRRTDYQVDEEALKRMMAGDVTALERTAPLPEEPFFPKRSHLLPSCVSMPPRPLGNPFFFWWS